MIIIATESSLKAFPFERFHSNCFENLKKINFKLIDAAYDNDDYDNDDYDYNNVISIKKNREKVSLSSS